MTSVDDTSWCTGPTVIRIDDRTSAGHADAEAVKSILSNMGCQVYRSGTIFHACTPSGDRVEDGAMVQQAKYYRHHQYWQPGSG
jgi:hypothetical protein